MSDLWNTRQVADFLGVSPETVLRWHRSGKLRGFPISTNALRFDPDEVRAWVAGTRSAHTRNLGGELEGSVL